MSLIYEIAEKYRSDFEKWITSAPYEREVERFPDSSHVWPCCYRDVDVHLAWDAWRAGVASRSQEGMAMVPMEPTEEVLKAMQNELPEHRETIGARVLMKAVYKAMLAAAEKP